MSTRLGPMERFLGDFEKTLGDTPSQNWLRDNAAAIRRAHAEMLADQRDNLEHAA